MLTWLELDSESMPKSVGVLALQSNMSLSPSKRLLFSSVASATAAGKRSSARESQSQQPRVAPEVPSLQTESPPALTGMDVRGGNVSLSDVHVNLQQHHYHGTCNDEILDDGTAAIGVVLKSCVTLVVSASATRFKAAGIK